MRKSLRITPLLIVGALLLIPQAALAGESAPCLPGIYAENDSDCLPVGPSQYLEDMAALGITFPMQPLPAASPDPELGYASASYARVTVPEAEIFVSLEEAIIGKNPLTTIETGFNYVSYIDLQVVEGKKYYMIAPGQWMRGGQLSGGVAPSTYAGLEFFGTPERDFGWVLFPVDAQRQPGLQNRQFTGMNFNRWDVIQVYDRREVEGLDWYMVGPGQWIPSRVINNNIVGQSGVALVYVDSPPPAEVDNGRWVEINLYEQTVSVYEDNQLVYAMLVSSGAPGFWTRPGLFQIHDSYETTPMTGAFEADRSDFYYLEDVPWTLYFDEARAFHGAYWHNNFGYVTSHGCANLSFTDSAWLFNWAELGDWVYVWDISGETPVDPSLYGAGGA
ncbi:MAG: L,D-transpeptidase [Chloroflexi bacterium]|nr:L,D-transpeptidase [Chloroflexota bacterium]